MQLLTKDPTFGAFLTCATASSRPSSLLLRIQMEAHGKHLNTYVALDNLNLEVLFLVELLMRMGAQGPRGAEVRFGLLTPFHVGFRSAVDVGLQFCAMKALRTIEARLLNSFAFWFKGCKVSRLHCARNQWRHIRRSFHHVGGGEGEW